MARTCWVLRSRTPSLWCLRTHDSVRSPSRDPNTFDQVPAGWRWILPLDYIGKWSKTGASVRQISCSAPALRCSKFPPWSTLCCPCPSIRNDCNRCRLPPMLPLFLRSDRSHLCKSNASAARISCDFCVTRVRAPSSYIQVPCPLLRILASFVRYRNFFLALTILTIVYFSCFRDRGLSTYLAPVFLSIFDC